MFRPAILGAVAALALGQAAGAAEKCAPYEPGVAQFQGKLYSFQYYGPPTYGEKPEKDFKATYLGVVMDAPFCVSGPAGGRRATEHHLTIVQLMMKPSDAPQSLLGATVAIQGQLFPGTKPKKHYTEVVMRPSIIQPIVVK